MIELGGWQRLVVVLAVLWCIAVTSFVLIEYREVSSERADNISLPAPPEGFVIDPKTHAYFFSWQPVDLLARGASSYTPKFGFNIYLFSITLLGPIFGMWALLSAIGWVIRGFKQT